MKVTLTAQGAPPGAITIGKVPLLQAAVFAVSAKAVVPVAIEAMLRGKLPLLPIETDWGPLVVVSRAPGKVRLVGVREILGAFAEPVPDSATWTG